jgi:hypothetical protein
MEKAPAKAMIIMLIEQGAWQVLIQTILMLVSLRTVVLPGASILLLSVTHRIHSEDAISHPWLLAMISHAWPREAERMYPFAAHEHSPHCPVELNRVCSAETDGFATRSSYSCALCVNLRLSSCSQLLSNYFRIRILLPLSSGNIQSCAADSFTD